MTLRSTSCFAALIAGCVLLAACNEKVEKKNHKVEGKSLAVTTPVPVTPGSSDGATETSATSSELTLKPTNPAMQSGSTPTPPIPSTENTSTTATADHTTTDTAQTARPADATPPAAVSRAVTATAAPVDFAQSPSPYLRAASKSQIKWQPFAAATFAAAAQQNKPVLIDIGTNWNHNCRAMAVEAYQDPQVVQTLNDKFVCVKVDADVQPDVAQRYKAAYRLIRDGETELPLTVFALPDGRPFDVLSYVPSTTQGDQAGMGDLLKQVEELYTGKKAQVEKQAELVSNKLSKPAKAPAAEADAQTLKQAGAAMAKAPEGALPQNAAAVAMLLLHLYSDNGDKPTLEAASKILLDQFRSPLRDQVLGGYFHPSPVDGTPRFEKLLPVQSSLLSANALAFAAGKKALHKEAAEEILRFCRDTLEVQGGGFYASQDADAGANDNGSYFTWNHEEILKLAGEGKDAKVFAQYLNAGDKKGPLYVTQKLQAAADANGSSYEDALKALKEVRLKLREARMQQDSVPFVNKAILASWNADAIMAYLDAYKYLGDAAARDFALQSADFVINNMVDPKQGVAHVFYKAKASEFGLLDDNAKFAAALMQCFEVSGQHEYLESAESIMGFVERRFVDKSCGLYTDRIAGEGAGLQSISMCPAEDEVNASGNASAALAWYALYQATSKDEYRDKAERLVKAGLQRGVLASARGATFGRAAELVTNGAPKVLIIAKADDATAKQMHEAALPVFRMGKIVEMMTPEEAAKTDYPPAKDGTALAYVCTAKNCAPPVRDAAKVVDLVKSFGRNEAAKSPATEVATPPGDAAAGSPKQTM